MAIACALEEQAVDASVVVPRLLDALERCPWWQTAFVQDAIRTLHRGAPRQRPTEIDWRIRYQPRLPWGEPDPGWPVMLETADIAYKLFPHPGPGAPAPPRSLDEIVAKAETRDVCDCCGVPEWPATGIPVCPQTAAAVAAIQFNWLDGMITHGIEDLFDALDHVLSDIVGHSKDLNERRQVLRRLGVDPDQTDPAPYDDDDDETEEFTNELITSQGVCNWLIEQGIEDVGEGRARLLLEMVALAIAHGDPNDIVNPLLSSDGVEAPAITVHPAPDVAGPRGTAAAAGAAVSTFEGDRLTFCRAHFKVSDIGAVLRALDKDRRFGVGPVIGSFAWADREHESMPILGRVQVSGDRLSLECLSAPRLIRGKAILSDLAGAWITHEADESVKLEDIPAVRA